MKSQALRKPIEPAAGAALMPVGLLLEGRRCLVVGGGRIAERKVEHLLHARAAVTVVCPEAADRLRELAADRSIRLRLRAFAVADVKGVSLAFAATNDVRVNRQVLRACRAQGTLCCSVDGNWRCGDFITPAILRRKGLIVAISTGGASCRRAKRVKDVLNRALKGIREYC